MIGLGLKEKVKKSFRKVKKDFEKVSQWIEYLNNKINYHDEAISNINITIEDNNKQIVDKINSIESKLENHENRIEGNKIKRENLKNEIDRINNSIDEIVELFQIMKTSFDKRNNKQKLQMNKLQDIILKKFKEVNERYNEIKKDITQKVSKRIDETIEKTRKNIKETKKNKSTLDYTKIKNKLTPAEKRIIALLVNVDRPMEYKDIAKRLGVSPVTIRRHISSIKKSDFPLNIAKNDLNRNVVILTKKAKKIIKKFD
ncbi:MAG: helix-turn-helix transcriptional regulator [Candidatus Woesearchaeota archaeon]